MAGAIARAEEANRRGLGVCLNFLGEHFEERSRVEATVDEYVDLLDAIGARTMDACLSIKPTQCGMMVDQGFYWESVKRILDRVHSIRSFLFMDIESSK